MEESRGAVSPETVVLRPELREFVVLMEQRLRANEARCSLLDAGATNVQRLFEAVDTLRRLVWTTSRPKGVTTVVIQAADVANWALIVAGTSLDNRTGKR